jgi:hypothetical protein
VTIVSCTDVRRKSQVWPSDEIGRVWVVSGARGGRGETCLSPTGGHRLEPVPRPPGAVRYKTAMREGRTPGRRVVVAIAGAEGIEHAVRLLERLRADGMETHLVLSPAAERTLGEDAEHVRAGASYRYAHDNQAARIASGSFLAHGMILAPCDAATARGVALGLASDLVLRAADVALKESRPLVIGIAPAAEPDEIVTRLSGLPGVSVVPLGESVDAGVDALLAQLGRAAEGS